MPTVLMSIHIQNLQHNTHPKKHQKTIASSAYQNKPSKAILHFGSFLKNSLYNTHHTTSPVLQETSEETRYMMVRLVFRHYTQIERTICTSIPLQASTTRLYGFTLSMHSSPSIGYFTKGLLDKDSLVRVTRRVGIYPVQQPTISWGVSTSFDCFSPFPHGTCLLSDWSIFIVWCFLPPFMLWYRAALLLFGCVY